MGVLAKDCGPKCRSRSHIHTLISAITKGNTNQIKLYLSKCYNGVSNSDTYGRTLLHMAASCGKHEVVEWLLNDKHADVGVRDQESGWTAIHRALFYGNLNSARLLIDHGANLHVRDKEGLSPLGIVMKDRLPHVEFEKSGLQEVYTWGMNSNFTLGHENESRRKHPELLEMFRKSGISIKQVSICKYHSVFLSTSGRVYTCGHGRGGRLGHGNEQTVLVPKLISALEKEEVCQITGASDHTVFLCESGQLYSCGLNDGHQLGQFPIQPNILTPKVMNGKQLKGKTVKGVCAGRFHTVIYTNDSVFTFGLNAGQLGHMKVKGEKHISQPRQVSALIQKDLQVRHVVTSDAATIVATKKGEIYVLHEYKCRKIATKWIDLSEMAVSGGHLDYSSDQDILRESGGKELIIMLLNVSGKVYMWRETDPILKRCSWVIKRPLHITDIQLTTTSAAFVTQDGEAYLATLPKPKSKDTPSKGEKPILQPEPTQLSPQSFQPAYGDPIKLEDVENINIEKVPMVHRATAIATDRKGLNFVVLQCQPNASLTEIPSTGPSDMRKEMLQFMEEANTYDLIHDVVLEVCNVQVAAHKYILASKCDYFRKLFTASPSPEGDGAQTVHVDVNDYDMFCHMLQFIYTDHCEVLSSGMSFKGKHSSTSHTPGASSHDAGAAGGSSNSKTGKKNKKGGGSKKGGKENQPEKQESNSYNPVKVLSDMAKKFGVKGLCKRLEYVKCVNGTIEFVPGKSVQSPKLKFEQFKLEDLYDVCIAAEDGTRVEAHKCILVARLDYFKSMLGSGWIETSNTSALTLPVSGDVLKVIIDYLYTDDSMTVFNSENVEFICQVLAVADQLLIARLKDMCEVALAGLCSLRNACDLLEFASMFNAAQLKTSCQQFICINLAALLESRALDLLSEPVLEELSEYYKDLIPGMSRRRITPWDEPPSRAELEEIERVSGEGEGVTEAGADTEERKAKKKKKRGRTKSSGEDVAVRTSISDRRLSTCSDGSDITDIAEDVSPQESPRIDPIQELMEGTVRPPTRTITMPETKDFSKPLASKQQHKAANGSHNTQKEQSSLSSPNEVSGSISKTRSPESNLKVEIKFSTQTSDGELQSPVLRSPTELHSPQNSDNKSMGLREIMAQEAVSVRSKQPQSVQSPSVHSTSHKKGKLSQKERKKQQQQMKEEEERKIEEAKQISTEPSTGAKPKAWANVNPWNVQKTAPVETFKDLVEKEQHREVIKQTHNKIPDKPQHRQATPRKHTSEGEQASFSWGLSRQQQVKPKTPQPVESPTSPHENPWTKRQEQSQSLRQNLSFTDIVRDEIQQTETLEKVTNKPLHLIQIEEQAISELLLHYQADDNPELHITVERVPRVLAKPVWAAKQQH